MCYVLLICLLTRPELQVEAEMIGYVEQKHRRVGSDVTAQGVTSPPLLLLCKLSAEIRVIRPIG